MKSRESYSKLKHKLTSANTSNSDKIILALKRQVQSQKSEIDSLRQKVYRQNHVSQSTHSSRRASRSASPQQRPALNSSASHSSRTTRPPHKPSAAPGSSSRGRSSSPASSSLGQRFDPTAYVRARQEKSRTRSSSFGSSRRYMIYIMRVALPCADYL